MDDCDCIGGQWAVDDLLVRYQYVSDFFIALAYFSIPLELVYFVKKSAVFPYRWVLVQFGAFIVLCGSTHLINMWTFREHTRTVAMVMTVAKVLTAIVSCATALMLVSRSYAFEMRIAAWNASKEFHRPMLLALRVKDDVTCVPGKAEALRLAVW